MATSASHSLRTFLAHPDRPEGTLSYHAVQGFLFAVASCPEPVLPSEWMPAVFDDQSPGYASVEEAQRVLDQLMQVYNGVNDAVLTKQPTLPADCIVLPGVMGNFDPNAPVCQWARGFLTGHQWLEESWDVELPDDSEEELNAVLMTLGLFSSRELAETLEREGEFGDDTLEGVAGRMLALFPDAMASYAHMGRTVLAEAYAAVEQRRVTKVGRNDPCPCGSGKKFKQCCGK